MGLSGSLSYGSTLPYAVSHPIRNVRGKKSSQSNCNLQLHPKGRRFLLQRHHKFTAENYTTRQNGSRFWSRLYALLQCPAGSEGKVSFLPPKTRKYSELLTIKTTAFFAQHVVLPCLETMARPCVKTVYV